ncbi:MAG: ribose-phosphate diphosphokinase [Alphaproteobacteria bacterium]|nr:ribose-phosphate diphosphokinase [Alphaproteobacteria bacterium]
MSDISSSDIVSEFRAAAVFFGSKGVEEVGRAFAASHRLELIEHRDVGKFSNGEIKLEIKQNIRGRDITYFAPNSGNIYDDMMETLITLDALHRHGAKKIAVFLPDELIKFNSKAIKDSPITEAMFAFFIKMFHEVTTIRDHKGQKVNFERIKFPKIPLEPGERNVIARGHSAKKLAGEISAELDGMQVVDWRRKSSLAGTNVIALASSAGNPNQAVLETAAMIYNLRQRGAAFINVVLPLWHYARQERTDNRRVPISAALIGKLLNVFRPNCILTQDLHQAAIQGLGRETHVDPIYSTALIAAKIAKLVKDNKVNPADILIGAVDRGAIGRATQLRRQLKENYGIDISPDIPTVDKRRDPNGTSEVKDISHKDILPGKIMFFVDDMTDSGGTFKGAAEAAKVAGVKTVIGFVTHVVSAVNPDTKMLNIAKLETSGALDALIGLDTVADLTPEMHKLHKIDIMSNSNWLAQNIREWAWWLKTSTEDASLKTLNDTATPPAPDLRPRVEAHLRSILKLAA